MLGDGRASFVYDEDRHLWLRNNESVCRARQSFRETMNDAREAAADTARLAADIAAQERAEAEEYLEPVIDSWCRRCKRTGNTLEWCEFCHRFLLDGQSSSGYSPSSHAVSAAGSCEFHQHAEADSIGLGPAFSSDPSPFAHRLKEEAIDFEADAGAFGSDALDNVTRALDALVSKKDSLEVIPGRKS